MGVGLCDSRTVSDIGTSGQREWDFVTVGLFLTLGLLESGSGTL